MAFTSGYMATANDTVTTNGQGATLHTINVGTQLATAVVTVYHGTTTSDPVVATIDASTANTFIFDLYLPKGLFVKLTTANAKVTVTYDGGA
jgi:hypothetical protein